MSRPRFSEDTVLSVAKTTLANARSNLEALAEFGLDEQLLNQFETDIQAAEALPDEAYNRIELRNLTQSKEEALDACIQWGRKLRTRLQLCFGKTSPQAAAFPSKEFREAQRSEDTMMRVMEILINLADQQQAQLAAFGQTPEILARGSEFLQALRDADAVQETKKDTKRSATQERYQSFQGIYDQVNRINQAGRLVFESDPVHLALFESKWPSQRVADEDVVVVEGGE